MNKEDLLKQYDEATAVSAEAKLEFLKGLSTEAKAIVIAALKERLEKQQQPKQQSQYPAPKCGYAFVGGGSAGRNGGDDNDEFDEDDYEDFEDDDLEDDFDADLEAFERELDHPIPDHSGPAANHSGGGGGGDSQPRGWAQGFDAMIDHSNVIVTDLHARRKEIGDFELLRLAKMGDVQSFKEFETMTGTGVIAFFDNNQRDALHYAVDGGSLDLIRYLVEEKKLPLRKDEKCKASALDFAVLLGRKQVVDYLSSRFPVDVASYDAALAKLAPPPPRFCISKAVPIVAPPNRPRVFWSASPIIPSAGSFTFRGEVLDVRNEAVVGVVVGMCNRANTGEHRGLDQWTLPAEPTLMSAMLSHSIVLGVTAAETSTGEISPAGVGVAVPLSSSLTVPSASGPVASTTTPVYVAGCVNVVSAHHKKGVAALIMTTLRKQLAPSAVVYFGCKERLPVNPITTLKWFRRSIAPLEVFSHLLASSEIYSDFYNYDDRLRLDWVAKETLSTAQQTTPTLLKWSDAQQGDRARNLALIATALPALLKKVGAELHLGGGTWSAENLDQTIASNGGMRCFFIPSEDGTTVTDLVCFRIRESRERDAHNAASALKCAVSVFSIFTTIAGEKRLLEQLVMAKNLGCHVFYATNTCGYTDSDFSKAMFEETEAYREFLYCVKAAPNAAGGVPVSVAANAVPAAKVYLPIGLV